MPDNLLDHIALGMGNVRSKPKDFFGRKNKDASAHSAGGRDDNRRSPAETSRERDFSADINARFAQDEELKILRYNIQNHPNLFILNNLMMSVQFFENFDEEILKIRNTSVTPREAELNNRLPSHKPTLIPDVLQQHVAKKVDFTYIDPTLKLTIELLHPIRIYMAFDNIEVTEQNYPSPYSSVNGAITYSVQLKPSPSHKGYVLLRRLDENSSKKSASVNDLHLASMSNGARDEIYSDGDSSYGAKSNASGVGGVNSDESVYDERPYGSQGNLFDYPSTSKAREPSRGVGNHQQHSRTRLLRSDAGSPAGSTSSGYRSGNYVDSDSDGYPRTTYNTPKTSKSSLDSGSLLSGGELPRQCFRKIEYTKDHKIYDARREKRHKTNSVEQMFHNAYKRQNYTLWYLNSTRFMKHFCRLFADQLAAPMDFDPDIRHSVQGGVICRTKLEMLKDTMTTKLEQFEIVPCVKSQWPECAQEWLDRSRATWPSYNAIAKIQEFGCHLVPEGRIVDKPDAYQDLEWQLVFPAAERYLETCLTYPQVRVYLIALMLQKTFIRPVDSIFGLTVAHIKHRLFWLVEEDARPSMWAENRTGESLMKLLGSLYRSISQDTPNLPDYFVRDKNLLQDRSVLLRTQKQLKRIMENPVMYVFHAMENIRHSSKFFPRLNFEELFRILTADRVILAHPELAFHVQKPLARPGAESDYDQVGRFWDDDNQRNNDKQKIYARKPVTKRSLINTLQAADQVVQIEAQCERLEPRRLSHLLDFFIRHFIKMAESCHKYRALPQKVAYVDHAERLSVLLAEHATHKDVAKTYLEKLAALKRRVLPSRTQNNGAAASTTTQQPDLPPNLPPNPPETPRRNVDQAIFTRPMMHRYESPEDLVKIQKSRETNAYELESARSSVSDLQATRINEPISVTLTEDPESFELRHSQNSTPMNSAPTTPMNSIPTTFDVEAKSSGGRDRIVSIVDTQESTRV